MASSSPEVNLTRAKELGKYSKVTGNGKPHEKSRVLADKDIMRMCGGCGKHILKIKSSLVCPCKFATHCSKECAKATNHICIDASEDKLSHGKTDPRSTAEGRAELEKFMEVVFACHERFVAEPGPSSDEMVRMVQNTKGDHQRILRYAEKGNLPASYVVGFAYAQRIFDRRGIFAIPREYEKQSIAETNEIAVKWLKVAATGGMPEAMFELFMVLVCGGGLRVDWRAAENWLARAHATGKMEYLSQILNTPVSMNFPAEFKFLYKNMIEMGSLSFRGESLAHLLMATRFREVKAWGGKTAMGEPFYGWSYFKAIAQFVGELKNVQSGPSFIDGEKSTLLVISARPGYNDSVDKCYSLERDENNLKFVQGVKEKICPDYELVGQASKVDGRTNHLISCKHNPVDMEKEAVQTEYCGRKGIWMMVQKSLDISKKFQTVGNCQSCVREAKQRLRAVSLGLFSISLDEVFDGNHYAARYANEDGVIVQDVFTGYTKPYMKQTLQCLMSNPADLHPLAVAEFTNLFWPIIWFWGSVHAAVQDTCNQATLNTIYRSLGDKVVLPAGESASSMAAFPEAAAGEWRTSMAAFPEAAAGEWRTSMAAFPEAAAGEWRIACGNEDCPRVDHEVKFSLCKGCKVRRYCNPICQKKDWPKHMRICKAGKNKGK